MCTHGMDRCGGKCKHKCGLFFYVEWRGLWRRWWTICPHTNVPHLLSTVCLQTWFKLWRLHPSWEQQTPKKKKKYTYSLEIDASTLNVNDYSQSCWLFEWEEVSGWRCCWGSARNNVFYFLRGPSRVGVRVFSSVSHDVVSVHFTLWSSLHAAFVAPRSLLLKSGRGKTSAINKALFFPTVYNPHFRYLSLCGSCLWIRILLDKSKTTEQGTI